MDTEPKPDVEAIIREIQADLDHAASADSDAAVESPAEEGLYENLEAANQTCAVGQARGTGAKALGQAAVLKALGPLIGELNTHHASVVRVLNKLVAVLDGRDETLGGDLVEKTHRRIDLLVQLSERLARVEETVAGLTASDADDPA